MDVRPANTIEGQLITDFWEVGRILGQIQRPDLVGEVSGVIVTVDDGDYDTVWITTATRPYAADCHYRCVWRAGHAV
ncbi:hypothetical protein [Sulfobacillus thermosulfidooxidans]|uniref:hypothetical protein n=1 Tax=Sulfobacillus thermosulfidooxidans TaxID=28034 RepID=UPI000300B06E|nr:hypothetical protein [Sulfobacillus thermosulfidooxidans]